MALIGCRNESAECLTLVVGLSRPSLLVARLTHPDGAAAPASLRHRHPVAGAGMAESLSTRAAVVLPLRLLKHFLTGVARLKRQEDDFFFPFLLLMRLSVTTVILLYLNCSAVNGARRSLGSLYSR